MNFARIEPASWRGKTADPLAFVRHGRDGAAQLDLAVQDVHCAGCIAKIERAVGGLPGVESARLNMSTKRLTVAWDGADSLSRRIAETVNELGYPAAPFDPVQHGQSADPEGRRLLVALAVAGFAMGNVMLLSVSIWAGAFSGMDAMTRGLFHWISALIALPAVAFAGMPFFTSAFRVLRRRTTNMDVPISLAVILASVVSLHATIIGGPHAYFDAAVALLFFLLVGRYLDHRARAAARSTAQHLLALQGTTAQVIENGTTRAMAARDVRTGMEVRVMAGDRVPVDGVVVEGRSDIDTSLVTGEATPAAAGPNDLIHAGTLNLTGVMTLRAVAAGEDTLLANIVRLMEAAEQGQAKYVRLADRIARVYAPAVHTLALGTFVGWWLFVGASWPAALMTAVAVLIITCPCALGLAVPVVQVVVNGRLMRHGMLVKSPDALERFAQIDCVVFDKTGTLTIGQPLWSRDDAIPEPTRQAAVALAQHSRHPLCRGLGEMTDGDPIPQVADVREWPGLGIEGVLAGDRVRLGSREFCGVAALDRPDSQDVAQELWIKQGDCAPIRFAFRDRLRDDAGATIERLRDMGLTIHLLSGDRREAAKAVAGELKIENWRGAARPDDKIAYVQNLAAGGHRVLMVGDGLNDGPALAAGHGSMSPASAAELSQATADIVFQGELLMPVAEALAAARTANRAMRQNFTFAILYNVIAVPIAIAGLATPLIAAIAMSSSSLIVTLNAFRLRWRG